MSLKDNLIQLSDLLLPENSFCRKFHIEMTNTQAIKGTLRGGWFCLLMQQQGTFQGSEFHRQHCLSLFSHEDMGAQKGEVIWQMSQNIHGKVSSKTIHTDTSMVELPLENITDWAA